MNEALVKEIEARYIPAQLTGAETETRSEKEAADTGEAKTIFSSASQKLQDVNNWHKWCGVLSSHFTLTDNAGIPQGGLAREGLFIRIDVPGPGSAAGDGYDWVHIEKTIRTDPDETSELLCIQARPAAHPQHPEGPVAHFLKDDATSSFVLLRADNVVRAVVYGRNEIPNTEPERLTDRVRNMVIGASGALGISKLQWKALVNGVLEP